MRWRCNGFTLTELLIVIGIIVILAALALPAWNTITGSRSQEAAANMIAAMVGLSRVQALNAGGAAVEERGVLFYVDPASGRSAMVLVKRQENAAVNDPDPNDPYKAWVSGVGYREGDRVVFPTRDDTSTGNSRMLVKLYRCKRNHTSSNSRTPPLSGVEPFENSDWGQAQVGNLYLDDKDVQFLPRGIGVQAINDPKGSNTRDRYLRMGVILFDRTGRLADRDYSIKASGPLGQLLGLTVDFNPTPEVRSQFGVAIYDQVYFANRGNHTEADTWFALGRQTASLWTNESQEEQWIDDNAVRMLVNRANGTLTRMEGR